MNVCIATAFDEIPFSICEDARAHEHFLPLDWVDQAAGTGGLRDIYRGCSIRNGKHASFAMQLDRGIEEMEKEETCNLALKITLTVN